MKYNSVLFDLDGTLVDNREGILNGFRYALEKLGKPQEIVLADTVIGPPLRQTFRDVYGMSGEQTEEAVRIYREFYKPVGAYQCVAYPHVEEMLARLKAAGCSVYLATSKARVFAEAITEHLGLAKYFDGLAGSELDGRLDSKTELLRHMLDTMIPADRLPAVMVGDRYMDAQGALDCGMDALAALWGFGGSVEFLPFDNVKAMFENAAQLCDWLLEG